MNRNPQLLYPTLEEALGYLKLWILGKVGRQGAICWLKKELSMVHGTLHIFLGIKLFCLLR